jgi:hypothetical protein
VAVGLPTHRIGEGDLELVNLYQTSTGIRHVEAMEESLHRTQGDFGVLDLVLRIFDGCGGISNC